MLSILAMAVAVVMLPAATAGSAPKTPAPGKNFSLVVETSEPRGFDDTSYEVTLTNLTGTQQVGSANIDFPAQLAITGEPRIGSTPVERVGQQLQPRNLDLPPGASVTITLGLRMPCVGPTGTWTAVAKQSNDFSGSGNDLTLAPTGNRLVTGVEGSCKLRFRDQPASARENAAITSAAFDPGGDPVTVETLDATGVPTVAFGGSVRIFSAPVGSAPGGSPLATVTAVDGVAPFADISIAASGNYRLHANADGLVDADASSSFQIVDVANSCAPGPGNCKAEVGNATLDGTVTEGDGLALLSLNLGVDPMSSTGCAGYVPPGPNYFEFELFDVTGTKTITLSYTKAEMKGRGPSSLEVCFASPQSFVAKDGSLAPAFDYDGPGPGTTGFAGLLPDCPVSPAGPCVLDRATSPGGAGATITAFAPASLGDPRTH